MEKHSVPQNIMDVEFKLFGSLTVRQFTYLAVTFITSLLIYFSGVPKLASVPVIFFVVIIGLGLALLTVNGQPFSIWFGNFIRSLFTPQRRVYHKTSKAPASLQKTTTTTSNVHKIDSAIEESAQRRKAMSERLKSMNNESSDEPGQTDEVEDPFMSDSATRLDRYFSEKVDQNMKQYNIKPNVTQPSMPAAQVKALEPKVQQKVALNQDATLQMNIEKNTDHRPINTSAANTVQQLRPPGNAQTQTPQLKVLNKLKPNQIAGFVCKKDNSPIDKAQVLIKDEKGRLLRSVYTDLHGKFIVPSTLPDGRYFLEISTTGQKFPEYQVELKGELLPMYRYLAQ